MTAEAAARVQQATRFFYGNKIKLNKILQNLREKKTNYNVK